MMTDLVLQLPAPGPLIRCEKFSLASFCVLIDVREERGFGAQIRYAVSVMVIAQRER